MKRILMIAFHYPPVQGSSGVHRTLSFSRHLPDHGWEPVVLTTTEKAYPAIEASQRARIPRNVPVERALAFDTARHLSFRGAFPSWLALPDRWVSWGPSAVLKGLRLIRQYRPNFIWSTYPIATAHLIGLTLHRMSGIPWIADFRDPMTELDPHTGQEFPADPAVRRVYRWLEQSAIKYCASAIFTTPGTAQMYAERFPDVPESRWAVIPNGYDEEGFDLAQSKLGQCDGSEKIELLHSGILYPELRDPKFFFEALSELRTSGEINSSNFRVVLRGSGHEALYLTYLDRLGIADLVHLGSPVSYEDALAEMLRSDGLLIFQASNCNWQIPAKAYEYLRAGRPILALTDPGGDTAKLLLSEGIDTIVPIDSKARIVSALREFLRAIREKRAHVPSAMRVQRYARRLRAGDLAALLNSLSDPRSPRTPVEALLSAQRDQGGGAAGSMP
jgi:glycosyltransferase involved in cell wall biosynthesis